MRSPSPCLVCCRKPSRYPTITASFTATIATTLGSAAPLRICSLVDNVNVIPHNGAVGCAKPPKVDPGFVRTDAFRVLRSHRTSTTSIRKPSQRDRHSPPRAQAQPTASGMLNSGSSDALAWRYASLAEAP